MKGESWRNHRQSKAHSLRVNLVEPPRKSHEAVLNVAAPLVFARIPQPQPSAAIPVDHKVLWVDHGGMDDSFDLDEPYHGADGSVIQFSAGLMYPSMGETIRHGMDQLAEELEAWGSGLAGEGFEGGMDEMGEQSRGR